ncbi:hypothetical protein [Paeniglutamicibacter kerguelensis]|uniref:Uncharacterized protein n=1 Tax=Paeniglutamicibacter kerguelensis TaxID=254788 RepID=A0ABS4XA74_9MICC|nr:hypothetical protein [Paeniglutamicibacter kerguelensis]MBP2385369.1 hypothetical protein [Paeniglutamicibacter kerguelensis]
MTEIPSDIGNTRNRYSHVRIKATGEIGRLAYNQGPSHLMKTSEGHELTAYVQFEETGEFRMFPFASLELVEF